jgi:hypothetical protein
MIITASTLGHRPSRAVATHVEDDPFIKQPEPGGDNCVFEHHPISHRQLRAEAARFRTPPPRPIMPRHQNIIATARDADRRLRPEGMIPAEPVNLLGRISPQRRRHLLKRPEKVMGVADREGGRPAASSAISEVVSTLRAMRAVAASAVSRLGKLTTGISIVGRNRQRAMPAWPVVMLLGDRIVPTDGVALISTNCPTSNFPTRSMPR